MHATAQRLSAQLHLLDSDQERWAAFANPEAVAAADPEETIDRALEAAREMLSMDMAYLADMREGTQHYRRVTGDGESFGARAGETRRGGGTYCRALLDGGLDKIVRDTAADPIVQHLESTHQDRIGAFIGVPVPLPDGSLYGTFCCMSHAPAPSLQDRDAHFMQVLAQLIGEQLEREERRRKEWELAAASGSAFELLGGLAARDGYTEGHAHAVVELALAIGERLGVEGIQLTNLHWVALLHDIGKLGVSEAILRKPGPLTEEEWVEMRGHADVGERIIASTPELAHLAASIRAEHERWDGTGYPDGLARTEIPLNSRIVFVSDAYNAMISDRPYRAALSAAEAREELERNAGTQFCPTVAAAALAVLAERVEPVD